MIPSFPIYLFDVDGTLLESAPDIVGAVEQVLSRHGASGLTFGYLSSFIGKHLFELFEEVFPHSDQEFRERLLVEYRETYWAREHASTKPYPGVAEGLAGLAGRKATATTKSTQTTRNILTKFGLIEFFDHVQGTDGFPAKPAPDVIRRALAALDAGPEDCLLVGDSAADMAAGRAAGVVLCAVDYGYGNRQEMLQFQPEFWISDLRELSGNTPQTAANMPPSLTQAL